MPITALPTPPTRDDPDNFAQRADQFLAALPAFATEANATAAEVNGYAATCQSAAMVVSVTAWVSGTTYAEGVAAYDPVDFLTYRRRVAGAGTTRPGLDATNWALLTGFGNVTLETAQTITGVKTFTQTIQGSVSGNAATATNATTAANLSRSVTGAGLATGGGTLTGNQVIIVTAATQAQAEAGTDNATAMTPLRMRQGLNAAGSAPVYACRAWVNFNGTGTVAIQASGNVSSITDNGVGDYTVNFTTAMPDANYAVFGTVQTESVTSDFRVVTVPSTVPPTTTQLRVLMKNRADTTNDVTAVYLSIFR